MGYSADALIQLDRMGEAIRHLDPLKSIAAGTNAAADLSFQEIPPNSNNSTHTDDDSVKSGVRSNGGIGLAKSVFHHNLIVAFVLRGELARGNPHKCREIIKNNCDIVSLKPTSVPPHVPAVPQPSGPLPVNPHHNNKRPGPASKKSGKK